MASEGALAGASGIRIRKFKNIVSQVGREHVFYRVDLMRDCVPLVVPMLISNVMAPDFRPEEIEEVKMKLYFTKDHVMQNPDNCITDLMHQVRTLMVFRRPIWHVTCNLRI